MLRHPARFKVAAAGIRGGKTQFGILWTLAGCLDTKPPYGDCWWVAPSYPLAMIGWRPMREAAVQMKRVIPGIRIKESEYRIEFPWGVAAQVKSAHDPDSLRGSKLRRAVGDEFAYAQEETIHILRGRVVDLKGQLLFISSPKGRGPFWHLYQRGLDPAFPDWAAFQWRTADNPYIPRDEIDSARQELPERIYRQEYEAEFLEESGVFSRVAEAATIDGSQEPDHAHRYIFGIDWARSIKGDFTAIVVYDATRKRMAHLERMRGVEFHLQESKIDTLIDRYRPQTIIAETNAMGAPLVERLQRKHGRHKVIGFNMDEASKRDAVDTLQLAFERGDIAILRDAVLIGELQAYEGKPLPSGRIRYQHPEGMHDDCVDALMMAVWGASKAPRPLTADQRDALRRKIA